MGIQRTGYNLQNEDQVIKVSASSFFNLLLEDFKLMEVSLQNCRYVHFYIQVSSKLLKIKVVSKLSIRKVHVRINS